ncbi:MAG: hypothetical protein WBQ25_04725 [Nitrososphaeraceae archaeon]
MVANGLWIIEATLNISNPNTIAISTNTKIGIGHELVAQHYRHLFYRQYTEHLKYSLYPNMPAKLSSLSPHKYLEMR